MPSVPLVALAVLAIALSASAQVMRVPSQLPTIGAALASATSGTTILVAPGTYKEVLTWPAVDGIRLVSEVGWTATRIDAGQRGSPVTFPFLSSVATRATVIEGFEITGGGTGIHIATGSPTIRGNRITGNVLRDRYGNSGGGILVEVGYPLITGNLIDGNELRGGDCRGSAIAVTLFGQADIVGNVVRGNKNLTSTGSTSGRGYGAIYAGGLTALIASNLIVDNENQTPDFNYGGGVFGNVPGLGVVVTIVNNTIVGNRCIGGSFASGGGIMVSSPYPTTAVVAGNIVVGNVVANAVFSRGGGVEFELSGGATATFDGNDVWRNKGGDVRGLAPGPNHRSIDPVFANATSFDLAPNSPLIDALPATWLPPAVSIDSRGYPRRNDGNGDGPSGDGARLDFGATEISLASLGVTGAFQLGGNVRFQIGSASQGLHVLLLDVTEGNSLVEPYGNLLLSPNFLVIANGTTPANVPMTLPNQPGLAGRTVLFQALTVQSTSPFAGAMTNRLRATLY